MNIIILDRGLGKMILLIAISAEQTIPIVSIPPQIVQEHADALGLKIPRPLYVKKAQEMPAQRVLVDDMDAVLKRALGCSIESWAISLNDPPPCARYCPK